MDVLAHWHCPHGHEFLYPDGQGAKWCPGCGTSSLTLDGHATGRGAVEALRELHDAVKALYPIKVDAEHAPTLDHVERAVEAAAELLGGDMSDFEQRTVTVASVLEKIGEFAEAKADQRSAFAMLGGGFGVTDEERARWEAAPTLDNIERDIRELAR